MRRMILDDLEKRRGEQYIAVVAKLDDQHALDLGKIDRIGNHSGRTIAKNAQGEKYNAEKRAVILSITPTRQHL